MLPYVVLLMCFFFVGPSLVLASLLNFGGRIPRYAFPVAFLWGQGCPCLAQELLQASEVAFFSKTFVTPVWDF